MSEDNKPSSQSVTSIAIIAAVTVLGSGALVLAHFDGAQSGAALAIVGTVCGGLLSALQPPGSLSNAVSKLFPQKEAASDDSKPKV
jgi:hypothetical protein